MMMMMIITRVLCFQLSFDSQLLKKFWFLKRIISPILETYYVAACRLTLLEQEEMPGTTERLNYLIYVILTTAEMFGLL